jgi:hypothetical protein
MYSYLSIEEILPSIEMISKLFREKKDELILKTKLNPIFTYQKKEKDKKQNIISSPKEYSDIINK